MTLNVNREKTKPPAVAEWILKHMEMYEEMFDSSDDFLENYSQIWEQDGKCKARRWYWKQVLLSLPSYISLLIYWRIAMFTSDFKTALRNLFKNGTYSAINIFGLAMGMACCVLMMLWVQDELQYDQFHENKNTIYRINSKWTVDANRYAITPGLLALALLAEIPEIKNAGRLMKRARFVFSYQKGDERRAFYEDRYFLADPAIFEMFTFPFVKGDQHTSLRRGMVITESMARKYFGDEDPIGKRLNVDNWYDTEVTGVIKDIPRQSHIQFEFIGELQPLQKNWPGGFTWSNFIHETYIQIDDRADPEVVAKKINDLYSTHRPAFMAEFDRLLLQPLGDIYLSSDIKGGNTIRGDATFVSIASIIALVILLIACINYVNLTTARSTYRSKEVGLKKVIGADRLRLVKQFLMENFIYVVIAFGVAMCIIYLLAPSYNNLSGKQLSIAVLDATIFMGMGVVVLVTVLCSGLYPSMYFAHFQPLEVIKGVQSNRSTSRSNRLRIALVVLEFTLSIILIIGAVVLHRQLHYLHNKQLGFNKENIVCIPVKEQVGQKYLTVKNTLLQNSYIEAVTVKDCLPMNAVNHMQIICDGMRADTPLASEVSIVDSDFIEVMNLDVVQGRSFSETVGMQDAVIINQAAVQLLDVADPVGKRIEIGGNEGQIVGVIKNTHFRTLRENIKPIVLYATEDFSGIVMDHYGSVFIKVNGAHVPEALAHIERIWQEMNPNYPFEYFFLDDKYDSLYKSERRLGSVVTYFTSLAIVIACLGLFGLASYVTEQRTKEIGVRRVLGASRVGLVILLIRDFLKWVLLALLLACPVGYIVMNIWLQGFANRIPFDWTIFVFAGLLTISIALFTVGYNAYRAASKNPVDSLKYE